MKFVLMVTMLSAQVSLAEVAIQKQQTRINFNQMIDENDLQKNEAQKTVEKRIRKAQMDALMAEDKQQLIDFIDVEISVGKNGKTQDARQDSMASDARPERPVVDRRYNSVGDIRVAEEFTVKMISKGPRNK